MVKRCIYIYVYMMNIYIYIYIFIYTNIKHLSCIRFSDARSLVHHSCTISILNSASNCLVFYTYTWCLKVVFHFRDCLSDVGSRGSQTTQQRRSPPSFGLRPYLELFLYTSLKLIVKGASWQYSVGPNIIKEGLAQTNFA